MRNKQITKRIALILMLVMAIATFSDGLPARPAKAKGAQNAPGIASSCTVALNGSKALSITKNGYKIKKIVSVKSSKKAVARATATTSKVTVYGVKTGKAKITVKLKAKKGSKTKTFTLTSAVTVKDPSASLAVNTLTVNETTKVKTANVASGATVTYSSSDANTAAVSTKGVVKAKNPGSAKISVTFKLKKTKYAKAVTKTVSAGTLKVQTKVDALVDSMSTDQKIAQMIMPSFRRWDGTNMTDLSNAPKLAEVLQRHQYGGVILFGQNITGSEQTVKLTDALQKNNAKSSDAKKVGEIPYMIACDVEGGAVNRLSMGTRGTGSMAIGATDDQAKDNAKKIGQMLGEEQAALGINVDLAPCIDTIFDLADLGLSTRVYSDDPQTNATLGLAFKSGLDESNVITTYKHFPGAGDGSDYPTSINITEEELTATGLAGYDKAIKGGAEMIMISAVTFPQFDDKHLMADQTTEGYYPATISPKIVNEMLREKLGFDGVVITDALEMEQFVKEPDTGAQLFTGDAATVEHDVQVAEKAINAGCDILLMPTDLVDDEAAAYFDEYIQGIKAYVAAGTIKESRLDESVRRILTLKDKRGVLSLDTGAKDVDQKVKAAETVVGSQAHHAVEAETAAQAVTLLKNNGNILPISADDAGKSIVFIGNSKSDAIPVNYGLKQLLNDGKGKLQCENRITDELFGNASAKTKIIIDYVYKNEAGEMVYSDPTTAGAIKNADIVIPLSKITAGDVKLETLQDTDTMIRGVTKVFSDANKEHAKVVLLSNNLPVDAARFKEADAIVCAYLSAGFGVDPTSREHGGENVGAFNANVPAAVYAIFGGTDMPGKLPINIYDLKQGTDGKWAYSKEILYPRGYRVP